MPSRIDELLSRMTLEEKAGQLNLIACEAEDLEPFLEQIRTGKIGGILKSSGAARNRRLQEAAVHESRLGIPLLIQDDVIHGHTTIFPIPLGEAASWDTAAVEQAARIAAREAAAAGIHLTYAPMVDVCRDARWGRIMETSGEDPCLGAQMAAARVRGFQGADLTHHDSVMACAKHFAGYGDATAGVDYLVNDFSERALREIFLPPFQTAVTAGAGAVMCAYTPFDGIPATASQFLLESVLRGDLGFGGMLVSDWDTINNLVRAGVAEDQRTAAKLAIEATLDVDMQAGAFVRHLPDLVRAGEVTEAALDAAVRRMLAAKEALGLFDDPFRGGDPAREQAVLLHPDHRDAARAMARKSFVLLQNAGILPLSRGSRIAVIGPLATAKRSPLGWWEGRGRAADTVSLWDGLREIAGPATRLSFAPGTLLDPNATSDDSLIAEAVAAARSADAVVIAVGETFDLSGEGGSRADLHLPGAQSRLIDAIAQTGTPLALVVYTGRPLVLTAEAVQAAALLVAWQPGTMGGLALADVLFGDHPPCGKLPVTFPRHAGQVPCYYGHRTSSHPHDGDGRYLCRHLDVPFAPLFPFGHGLSYTTFRHEPPQLAADLIGPGDTLVVSTTVTNTGATAGREVVQLYLRDEVCPVVRPVLELHGFQPVDLAAGAPTTVRFEIPAAGLRHWGSDHRWHPSSGWFTVFTGPDSRHLQGTRFCLTK